MMETKMESLKTSEMFVDDRSLLNLSQIGASFLNHKNGFNKLMVRTTKLLAPLVLNECYKILLLL